MWSLYRAAIGRGNCITPKHLNFPDKRSSRTQPGQAGAAKSPESGSRSSHGMWRRKKRRYWPAAPIAALLQSGGADFLAPWEGKSMSSVWSRGGVWCRAGTEAFSNSSSPMVNPEELQVPRSCRLLTSLSPGSVSSQPWLCLCGSSGLVFPPQQRPIQCFPRRIMVCFAAGRMENILRTSSSFSQHGCV